MWSSCCSRSRGVSCYLPPEKDADLWSGTRYGRFVGDCYRADGGSVAELLVLSGWAVDWPRYSKGEYADEQAHAQAMRLGLWAGKYTLPWEWRAPRRGSRAATQPSSAN